MPTPLSYLRIFADHAGESHVDRVDLAMKTKMFAPPAPPLDLSELSPASTFALLRLPSEWHGEWHPTPSTQWLFFLTGTVTMKVSDGTSFDVQAGTAVLLEDTTGKGHQTTVVGNTEVIIASVQVPQPH